eukprot:2167758-Rhodomonas_salina.4
MSASYNLVVEGCALDADGAMLLGVGIPIMLRVLLSLPSSDTSGTDTSDTSGGGHGTAQPCIRCA